MTQVSADEIESRLRELPGSVTFRNEDARAMARLDIVAEPRREGAARRTRLRVAAGAIAGALILIVMANTIAVYLAPRYGRILADAPGIGPISGRFLGAVGLSASDVTLVGDSATSSGHTLKLEGVYADGLRTVLFVSIDGKGLSGNPKEYGPNPGDWAINYDGLTLTDQFLHSYDGWGVGGPTVLQFKALVWPASEVGARLTLHVTGLWAMWRVIKLGPNTVSDPAASTVHGDWYLHATVARGSSHNIPLPASVRTAGAVYTFTSIVASSKTLVIHWTLAGPVNAEVESNQPQGPNPPSEIYQRLIHDYFSPRVYDSSGSELQMQYYGYTWPKVGPAQGEMAVFISGPGQYRIELGAALTAPDQQRWIVVP